MTGSHAHGSGARRLNQALQRLGSYVLMETDVTPAFKRAKALGLPLLDTRIGDPTLSGFGVYPRYRELVAETVLNDPKAFSYAEARGVGELREILGHGNPEFGKLGYSIPPDNIIVGPGTSGGSRSLYCALMRPYRAGKMRDEVVIPDGTFLVWIGEAELSGARLASARLAPDGQADLDHLAGCITKNTKAVVVTTVGNPLGIAMRHDVFAAIIGIVNRKEREFNHPIALVADTIYEGFRSGSDALDPIAMSMRHGRIGPTIEMYSISKMICAPGARLGWMRIYHEGGSFAGEVDALVESLAALAGSNLGANPTFPQIALARLYAEISDAGRRHDFFRFKAERRAEMVGRVRKLIGGLAGIDALVFPECYYGADGRVDPATQHSLYAVVGKRKALRPRSRISQAREIADFCIERGIPVLLGTPFDCFKAHGLRGQPQEFVRLVGLLGDREREMAIDAMAGFAESRKAA